MRRLMLVICGAGGSVLSLCLLLLSAGVVSSEPMPAQPDADSMQVHLPYQIPGTTLVAQKLVCYEGPYLEDNSNDEVVDVAALILKNEGCDGIEEAWIELSWDDGSFVFEAYMIPPGETVLVCDAARQFFGFHLWTSCAGYAIYDDQDWTFAGAITIEETNMSELTVTNRSSEALKDISIIYKTYLASSGIYVGGSFYRTQVSMLLPGETAIVNPWGYAGGNSKVVYVGGDKADSH